MRIKYSKHMQGTSLIEVIIYMFLLVLFFTIAVSFLISMQQQRLRFMSEQIVTNEIQSAESILLKEIHPSKHINSTSTFNINLANDSSKYISLNPFTASDSPMLFYVSNGQLMLKKVPLQLKQ